MEVVLPCSEDLQWACDLNKDFVFAGDLTLDSA